jgi:hypothetical protein
MTEKYRPSNGAEGDIFIEQGRIVMTEPLLVKIMRGLLRFLGLPYHIQRNSKRGK